MNNLKNSLVAVFLATLSAPILSFAGNEAHGGDGVLYNGKPYLLDLVEFGVELQPFFDSKVSMNLEIRTRVHKLDLLNSASTVDMVAKKLTELRLYDALLVETAVNKISSLNWALVTKNLVDVKDEDTVLKMNNYDLVQLAVRKNNVVRISREFWNLMDDANKAALILHETFYAITGTINNKGDSSAARVLTGYIFSQGLKTFAREGLLNTIHTSASPGSGGYLRYVVSKTNRFRIQNGSLQYAPYLSLKANHNDDFHDDTYNLYTSDPNEVLAGITNLCTEHTYANDLAFFTASFYYSVAGAPDVVSNKINLGNFVDEHTCTDTVSELFKNSFIQSFVTSDKL